MQSAMTKATKASNASGVLTPAAGLPAYTISSPRSQANIHDDLRSSGLTHFKSIDHTMPSPANRERMFSADGLRPSVPGYII